MGSTAAQAHAQRFGDLEIVHPAIMVPAQLANCSCAHVKIVNHGTRTEYFLGAEIDAASRTHLLRVSATSGVTTPVRVAIAPGTALDLNRHEWCLFMSGINATLEADIGMVNGRLLFENHGAVGVEFMIDAAPP